MACGLKVEVQLYTRPVLGAKIKWYVIGDLKRKGYIIEGALYSSPLQGNGHNLCYTDTVEPGIKTTHSQGGNALKFRGGLKVHISL